MKPLWVVPTLDPSKDLQTRLGLGLPDASVDQLTFQRGKEALCHGVVIGIPHAAHGGAHTHLLAAVAKLDAGVLTALIGVVNTDCGFRVIKAMSSACVTKSAVMRTPNAQPTTSRLNTSVTAARYKKPAHVGKYVMSATHNWLMSVATNLRLTRSGAGRWRLSRWVVTQ